MPEAKPRLIVNVPLGTSLSEIMDDVILQAVRICGGNLSQAARKLDVNRITVKRRVKHEDLARSESDARFTEPRSDRGHGSELSPLTEREGPPEET